MIPIQLELRNFMCYRDNVPTISFEGVHTACISGNNGNGKSALIDAMTWALWGKTRASSDDELIFSGQTEAEVQFDFAVGEARYRIIRRRTRAKSQKTTGKTILEFQLATPDGFKVLTADRVDDTEKKIRDVLRMDYETFINSAFLRQGHSDEFTKKRPGERKAVLGNILQLGIYEELEEEAKERARGLANDIAGYDSAIENLQADLKQRDLFSAQLEEAKAQLACAERTTAEKETLLRNLRKDKETLESLRKETEGLAALLLDNKRNYELWTEQAGKHRERILAYEGLLAQRSLVEENYERLQNTKRRCQELDARLKQVTDLNNARHQLELTLVKEQQLLNEKHSLIDGRISQLEETAARLPQLTADLTKVAGVLQKLDEFEAVLRTKQDNLRMQQARVHHAQSEEIRLAQEVELLEEKLTVMSHDKSSRCPLCNSALGPDEHKTIEEKYKQDLAALIGKLDAIKAEGSVKAKEVRKLEDEMSADQQRLKMDRQRAQNRHGNLNKAISDASSSRDRIVTEKAELQEIEIARTGKSLALGGRLNDIDREIASCGYDRAQHELFRSQLADLERHEKTMRDLEEAVRRIQEEKEGEDKALRAAGALRSKIDENEQKTSLLRLQADSLASVADALVRVENEYQDLVTEQKRVQQVMGAAQARLEYLDELAQRERETQARRNEDVRQEKTYRDLAQAFGKNGIQAMLIETAIPEIENEANRLLGRMTDNRMHIKMEQQRETKKGETTETMDINISDELGTRNYEMFSGGEAFRIDFAIRIALSRLLARRAGAPLPTLIIDEGFGTQDSTGIEKIKEAITSIQEDFEKILVITHIADFKDAFPMRIEVVKTAEGSTISLN